MATRGRPLQPPSSVVGGWHNQVQVAMTQDPLFELSAFVCIRGLM